MCAHGSNPISASDIDVRWYQNNENKLNKISILELGKSGFIMPKEKEKKMKIYAW